ncbi:Molybdenum import ATP-binding protein ModC (fragment) [Candidatus Accumulibacter aalborgensis]|uniref:Molybdenum import ATP-binding protein ModC n=1 Tax=Candidatus Accumulibacter aalborgensis TaxID=1860102 RepID=A0A1A8XVB6_9PROT
MPKVAELLGIEHLLDRSPGQFSGGERQRMAIGTLLRCRIHARDVSLALVPQLHTSILNSAEATVVELASTVTPGHVLVRLDVAGEPLLARITRRSADRL